MARGSPPPADSGILERAGRVLSDTANDSAAEIRAHDILSTDHEELLEVLYHGLTVGVSVKVVGGDVLMGSSVGLSHGPVVVALNEASDPWAAIRVVGLEQDVARYAARLDLALTAMDDGDYSTALALLEDAGLHAPTLLEKARSLAVMAVLTSAVLGESIGALQSLSLYYETYQTWTSAVSASDYGKAAGSLSAWIREALAGAFTPYADAYPEAAKSLSLDQISVRSAEAARGRNDSPRPVAKWSQITSMFDDLKKDARRFAAADNAGEWFGAERERLARLDARALLDEADHAVAQGFREARWFAETLAQLYALGLADDKKRIYTALRRAADGCDEPWRGQLEVFLGASADLAEVIGASSADSASALQIRTSLKSARRFGLHRTAAIFGELVRLGPKTAEPPTFAFDELPPPLAWWTTEYLDWFIATTWSLLNRPDGVCGRASPVCEQVLMAKQPYICYDTSEKHRLFAPGVGYAMWMLVAQPRVDPWWDHAFYLGIGTHFRQWQRVLLKPVGEGVAASQ